MKQKMIIRCLIQNLKRDLLSAKFETLNSIIWAISDLRTRFRSNVGILT